MRWKLSIVSCPTHGLMSSMKFGDESIPTLLEGETFVLLSHAATSSTIVDKFQVISEADSRMMDPNASIFVLLRTEFLMFSGGIPRRVTLVRSILNSLVFLTIFEDAHFNQSCSDAA